MRTGTGGWGSDGETGLLVGDNILLNVCTSLLRLNVCLGLSRKLGDGSPLLDDGGMVGDGVPLEVS